MRLSVSLGLSSQPGPWALVPHSTSTGIPEDASVLRQPLLLLSPGPEQSCFLGRRCPFSFSAHTVQRGTWAGPGWRPQSPGDLAILPRL